MNMTLIITFWTSSAKPTMSGGLPSSFGLSKKPTSTPKDMTPSSWLPAIASTMLLGTRHDDCEGDEYGQDRGGNGRKQVETEGCPADLVPIDDGRALEEDSQETSRYRTCNHPESEVLPKEELELLKANRHSLGSPRDHAKLEDGVSFCA